MKGSRQNITTSTDAREVLRRKGQFATPDWVARAMVGYLVAGGHRHVFDPAFGAGAFALAGKDIEHDTSFQLCFSGTEVDPDTLQEAHANGVPQTVLSRIEIRDFVLDPPQGPFEAIVANPPYIRHHRLSAKTKRAFKDLGRRLLGKPLDGRAGIHVCFLLRSLQLLDSNGRLAFIMPADTCEGVFADTLWRWITRQYSLEAVVTFAPDASPFPTVDTNPIIFMIRNAKPGDHFLWAECSEAETEKLRLWTLSGFRAAFADGLLVRKRQLQEGLATGLSRPPLPHHADGPRLGQFARVMRGIATGANEFFFLTTDQVAALAIPDELLVPAIGRTRDVPGDEITRETIQTIAAKGRPTLLFSPDGRPLANFPAPVRDYIKEGEELGIHNRPLVSTRTPWYKMEHREAPPILFAYLGRRNARFIRNVAGVVPLTGFLCVYPHQNDRDSVERVWRVLSHPKTQANLRFVGKSYGGGAIKVEPRALEKLPIPQTVASQFRCELLRRDVQTQLF